jgi:two-component system sensor histidine kinase MtrB
MTEVLSGLPFALSLAATGTATALAAGRRRGALNEALHELRRPMQALALALPAEAAEAPAVDSSLLLAVAAMDRLECEINGGTVAAVAAPVPLRRLAEVAATRWRHGAAAAGASIEVDWAAGEAIVRGDAVRLAQALDNLIINGIEHGRGNLIVRGRRSGRFVTVAVRDRGEAPGRSQGRGRGRRLGSIGRRRGHGLRVVRRTAAEHGGRFDLVRSERATEAVLELPALGSWEEGG